MTRRRVLQVGTAAVGGLLINLPAPARAAAAPPTFVKHVVRRDDMLALRFEFHNLHLVRHPVTHQLQLERTPASAVDSGVLVVVFGPQSIGERAFDEPAEGPEPAPVPNRLAAESRLAFTIPDAALPLPYRLDELMFWHRWTPRVVPAALPAVHRPDLTPELRQPRLDETSLELPYRLELSPDLTAGWAHASGPVVRGGRTELWHTRLGTRVQRDGVWRVDEQAPRTVRAVWTRLPSFDRTNPPPVNEESPFQTPLSNNDRWQLVRLTSDFRSGYQPLPVTVDRLLLSPLGATFDGRGSWDTEVAIPDPDLSILDWRHRMGLGRDSYVRVVKVGSLYPLRHAAAYVEVTERKFERPVGGGPLGAYLRKRRFVVPRQLVVRYPDDAMPADGRGWPFVEARLTTAVTPILDLPGSPAAKVVDKSNVTWGEEGFWPAVAGQPFLFNVVLTDRDGQVSECAMPLIFVGKGKRQHSGAMQFLADEYSTNPAWETRRTRPFDGQQVAFAESNDPGDTSLEVNRITFQAETDPTVALPVDSPRFWPGLEVARVRLQAIEQIRGGAVGTGGVPVRVHPAYVAGQPNTAGLFAKVDGDLPVAFDRGDRSGGLVTPNLDVIALSRLGPVGAGISTDIPPTEFDPADFFADAKLLGVIDLAVAIKKAPIAAMPKLRSRTVYPGDNPALPPSRIETVLDWSPELQPAPAQKPVFEPLDGASFVVAATSVQPLNPPGAPTMKVRGELRNIALNLIGNDPSTQFLRLRFGRIRFESEQGSKTRVDVDLAGVEFLNALSFVERLKELLPDKGSGPTIDVTENGVTVSTGVNLPSVPAGVINIYNLAFSGAVVLPFDGTPLAVRFGFCSKEDPFVIAYTIFGGGGYAEIELDAQSVKSVLVSLQAGVYAEMDFGIASGSISAAFGIEMALTGDDLRLMGFFRFHGEVEALGLITISISLELEMHNEGSSVVGSATLTVEVDLTLISVTKSVQVKKRLTGGSGGGGGVGGGAVPGQRRALAAGGFGFEDLMDATAWNSYAGDFATAAFV